MINLENVFSQEELQRAIAEVNREVGGYFAVMPAGIFFTRFEEAWSPAENLVHLIKSVSAVAQALRLPKLFVRLLFGASLKSSRRFEQLKEDYRRVLAQGGKASGRYVPVLKNAPQNLERAQTEIIEKWDEVNARLLAGLRSWNEKQLEKLRLPHPLLGKLTVREMIFFTLYHNRHHMNIVRRRAGHARAAASE